MKLNVIIPSKDCSLKLLTVTQSLISNHMIDTIIIVNDGSKLKSRIIINKIQFLSKKIKIINNFKNIGQGASIKKAIKFILKKTKNISDKIITIDDDSQHHPDDIKKIIKKYKFFYKNKFIVYGVRFFNIKNTPCKSLIGNFFMKFFFYYLTKKKIADTQTGLRLYPINLASEFTKIKNNGFDFLNIMNFMIVKLKIILLQEKIKTIYFNQNKLTKFKSIHDSLKVIKSILNYYLKNKKNFIF